MKIRWSKSGPLWWATAERRIGPFEFKATRSIAADRNTPLVMLLQVETQIEEELEQMVQRRLMETQI